MKRLPLVVVLAFTLSFGFTNTSALANDVTPDDKVEISSKDKVEISRDKVEISSLDKVEISRDKVEIS